MANNITNRHGFQSGYFIDGDGEPFNIVDNIKANTDALGSNIVQNTRNVADLAGHYPFSPERFRLYIDGNRQNIQYGAISQYNKQIDYHELIPNQGEVVTLKTAERFRYVVGFIIEPSYALAVSRSLEEGDKIVFGLGKDDLENDMANADGWFWIYTPDLGDNQIRMSEYRNGTEVDFNIVSLQKALQIWKRLANRINWYNVGNNEGIETYTEDGEQYNPLVGKTSVDNGRGPELGNHRVTFSIRRGASSSPITLEVGSIGVKTLGGVTSIKRSKIGESSYTFTTINEWVPILALRTKDTHKMVSTVLSDINIVEWGGAGDVEVLVKNHDPSLVLDSGGNVLVDSDFSTPELMTKINTSIEVTKNVAQAPDKNGTPQSSILQGPLGGYTVGYSSFLQEGSGQNKVRNQNSLQVKRLVPDGDITVFWARAENAETAKFQYVTEQDW